MIDFRYHLVSIVAVFLALAVGVGLGSTALRGPVLNDLGSNVNRLTKENKDLRSNVTGLRTQNQREQQFAAAATPRLVKGALVGQQVAVVSLPGAATRDRDALVKNLGLAGASVVSMLSLTPAFTDPANAAKISDLSVRDLDLVPGLQLPPGDDAVAQASALVGAALVGSKGVAVSAPARSGLLQSFTTLGIATVHGPVRAAATAVVVVGGAAATGANAKQRNAAALTVVRQLIRNTARVVVGDPTSAGAGPVSVVRADSGLTRTVSTVDDIDQPTGQVAAVLALVEEAKGRSGQYGTQPTATALMPAGT